MSRRRRLLEATLVVAFCSTACDSTKPEPGPEQVGTPPVTPVPPEPVHPSVRFSPTARFVDEAGAVDVRHVWLGGDGTVVPAALAPDGAGGFRTSLAGNVGTDGYLVIPDVPEGPYYLRANGNYLWGAAREQELVATWVQRADLDWAPQGTTVQMHVSGLAPWQASDVLQLSAPNGGPSSEDLRLITPLHYGGTLPTEGATQLDARVTVISPLLNGARGDSVWVQQLSERPAAGSSQPYTAVVRSFRQPAFTMAPGAETPLDAALTEGTHRSVSFELDVAAFDTVSQQAHPQASGPRESRRIGHDWAIGARPGTEPFAKLGSAPQVAFAGVSMDLDRAQYDVTFVDAFPQEWLRVMQVSSGALVSYQVGREGFQYPYHLYRYDTLAAGLADGPLAPRLSAARNLRINGLDATVARTGIGSAPVLSWDPPVLGTATRYFVSVMRYLPGSYTFSDANGYLVTDGTELRLPPEVVPSGSFVIKVTATSGAGTLSPHEGTLPLDVAEAGTSLLTR